MTGLARAGGGRRASEIHFGCLGISIGLTAQFGDRMRVSEEPRMMELTWCRVMQELHL